MVWYATREDVKAALDFKDTARNNKQIDQALESASRKVEEIANRVFYATTATRYKDWPNWQYAQSWKLYLDADEVISVTQLTAGGVAIPATDYFLEPANSGPPYSRIEIDLDSSSSFRSSGTHQRQIAVTGLFGYQHTSIADATTLATSINSSTTTVDVANSAAVGVGSVLVLDDNEHMIVTERAMLTTGQVTSVLSAAKNDVLITGLSAGQINQGEVLQIDAEKLLVTSTAGTTATVERAYDGSVLAAHPVSTTIYAARRLTVTRAALGTSGSAHTAPTGIDTLTFPGTVVELAIAYALDQLLQQQSGYARTVGSGDTLRNASGGALRALEAAFMKTRYTRKFRQRGI